MAIDNFDKRGEMVRIILLRHPETTANSNNLIYGQMDFPYTQKGQQQFEEAQKRILGFRFEKIYSSHLERALKLAQAISQNMCIEVQIVEALSEMGYGIFEGLTMQEALLLYPEAYSDFVNQFETTVIPESEGYDAFKIRVRKAIDFIIEENQDCLIVTHGGVIHEAIEHLLELKPGQSWSFYFDNTAIVEFKVSNERRQLINLHNLLKEY